MFHGKHNRAVSRVRDPGESGRRAGFVGAGRPWLHSGVLPEIRVIAPEELLEWVRTTLVVFHVDRPPDGEAAYRRDVLAQDLGRTLAAVDDEQRIAGTLFSYPAELALPGGTCLTADALTSVTVLPTHRRRGLLTRMLEADLRAARDRGEAASILIAAEYPIYGRFGFGPATRAATYTIDTAAADFCRTPVGSVDMLPAAQLREVAPRIFDHIRRGRPGQIDRHPSSWDARLGLIDAPWAASEHPVRCAVFNDTAGDIQGYLIYRAEGRWDRRLPRAKLEVVELMSLTPDAYVGLWRYCCEMDLVSQVSAGMRPTDEPLPWLLHNPRAALPSTQSSDLLWLRPLDVPATLAARRYASSARRLVLEVSDPLNLCGGRFALEGGPDGAACRATTESADLSMSMAALGSLLLGGVSLHVLAQAGLIDEQRAGALALGENLFNWPVAPWCSTFF
jgi:predicted acetyltransferase